MLNVVVCVSGGGTNLQAILDAVESSKITNTRIAGVISNNAGAYALERAKAKMYRLSAFLQRSMKQEKHLTGHCCRAWMS